MLMYFRRKNSVALQKTKGIINLLNRAASPLASDNQEKIRKCLT